MDQSDIREVVRLLEHALKSECWDSVEEATSFLKEYLETGDLDKVMEE